MKVELMRRFESFRDWAIGLHIHGAHTLVVLVGTSCAWGFSRGTRSTGDGFVFGLCLGPLTIGFCS